MSDYQAALKEYVEQAKASGMSYDEVRAGLISGGWDAAMVDQLLPEAFGASEAAPAVAPAAPPGVIPTTIPTVGSVSAPPVAAAPPAAAPPSYAPPAAAPPAYQAPPPAAYPQAAYPSAAAGWGQNTSGGGAMAAVPPEVEAMGWSWGAFGLNWIWGIANKTWVALVCLIPCVGFFVAIWLGIGGHKMAWQNRRFEGGVAQFQETMKAWNTWGLVIFILNMIGSVIQVFVSMAQNK